MHDTEWNKLVLAGGGDFMQSAEWGAFQRALGRRVERVSEGGALAQMIFRPLPLGYNHAYVPMGPLFSIPHAEVNGEAFTRAMHSTMESRTVFIEYDLLLPVSFLGGTTPDTRQPLSVQIVPLGNTDEGRLKSSFHPTLQENIGRAERHNLILRQEKGWEVFYRLYTQTMRRHELRPWSEEYFRTLWNSLAPAGMVEMWTAYLNDMPLVSNMYILFGKRVTHLFGGSSDEERNVMAPHFLHWRMMHMYGQRGFAEYDMGKVDEKVLPGLTTFKTRFGGATRTYPGNVKNIVRPVCYRLYTTLKSFRSA